MALSADSPLRHVNCRLFRFRVFLHKGGMPFDGDLFEGIFELGPLLAQGFEFDLVGRGRTRLELGNLCLQVLDLLARLLVGCTQFLPSIRAIRGLVLRFRGRGDC